ncbi:MAG TPA: hypothetical protein VMT03_13945 [Polyangia bacterium]|nr:hypothetical protein [Polyangia bacterium]
MKLVLCLSLLTAVVLTTPAQAQLLCALGPTTKPYDATADATPPANLQADLKRVKAVLCPKGCGKVVLVVNPTTPDALTATTGIGVTEIAFNPKFLAVIKSSYGPNATIGFVAHQLGHHLDTIGNHPSWMNSGWDAELRADAWAGCALGKADLKPAALQSALSAMAAFPPATHPAWTSRRPTVEAAYSECSGGQSLPALPAPARKDAVVASGGGCTADRECRNGRVCVAGRCGISSGHKACGKDTDCPDPEECGAEGTCQTPPGAESTHASAAPSDFTPAKATETPAAEAPARPASGGSSKAGGEVATCEKSCYDIRDRCLEASSSARTQCLSAIQAEPNYRACSCPRYPEGNYSCYQLCTEAYQRGTSCLSDKKATSCQTEASGCLNRCLGEVSTRE